jgi:hypothetical protein
MLVSVSCGGNGPEFALDGAEATAIARTSRNP